MKTGTGCRAYSSLYHVHHNTGGNLEHGVGDYSATPSTSRPPPSIATTWGMWDFLDELFFRTRGDLGPPAPDPFRFDQFCARRSLDWALAFRRRQFSSAESSFAYACSFGLLSLERLVLFLHDSGYLDEVRSRVLQQLGVGGAWISRI